MNVNYNGKIFPSDIPIFGVDNRAFLYGDALFESIRMLDGEMPFLGKNVKRLLQGLAFFKYQIPKKYNTKYFQKEIQKIASGNARIRITVFRSSGGLYTPKNNRPKFLITASPLSSSSYTLNKKGLQIGLFNELKLPCTLVSNFKTCNSLPYIRASQFKEEQNLDDCILLNEKNRIAEACSSNIFLLQKNTLITPSLSEGCVKGTLRSVILEIAASKNIQIKEKSISLTSLKKADEIWLTNAIQGIRWVANFVDKFPLPSPTLAQTFIRHLNHY